jgi:excisionase family DNA binding protein
MGDLGETLTPEEIASFLRVRPQTVWRLIRRGDLPAMKVGRVYLIPRADFDRWCRERRLTSTADEVKGRRGDQRSLGSS